MIHEPAERGGRIWMSNSHWGIKPTATGFALTTKLNSGKHWKKWSTLGDHTHTNQAIRVWRHTPLQLSCEMHVTVVLGAHRRIWRRYKIGASKLATLVGTFWRFLFFFSSFASLPHRSGGLAISSPIYHRGSDFLWDRSLCASCK
jgi:hypothetical protein